MVALLFWHKERLFWNKRATTTRHNYSRWRRPFWISFFFPGTNAFIGQSLNDFNCKHYVLWFVVLVEAPFKRYGNTWDKTFHSQGVWIGYNIEFADLPYFSSFSWNSTFDSFHKSSLKWKKKKKKKEKHRTCTSPTSWVPTFPGSEFTEAWPKPTEPLKLTEKSANESAIRMQFLRENKSMEFFRGV